MNHGWISYSGYNVNTPTQPGHVFEVTWNGTTATWTDLSSNLPDFPITSLVRDHQTGDLYAASDFGVMRLGTGSSTWKVAGKGLPMVEVPHLTIVSHERRLFAATHGRSAWVLRLPDKDDEDTGSDRISLARLSGPFLRRPFFLQVSLASRSLRSRKLCGGDKREGWYQNQILNCQRIRPDW